MVIMGILPILIIAGVVFAIVMAGKGASGQKAVSKVLIGLLIAGAVFFVFAMFWHILICKR